MCEPWGQWSQGETCWEPAERRVQAPAEADERGQVQGEEAAGSSKPELGTRPRGASDRLVSQSRI